MRVEMTLSLADRNRPGARPALAPSLLALLAEPDRAAPLLELARETGLHVITGEPNVLETRSPVGWVAILIDLPADAADLAQRAAALRAAYGDDFALLLASNGPELPDDVDDLAPPDAPDEARRAFRRAARTAAERKAAR